jgi:hypothetical protein
LDRFLVSFLDGLRGEMLIDLQALLGREYPVDDWG